MEDRKKGILVVNFGTTYEDTRMKTTDVIVSNFREEYNDCEIYEAWTSRVIARILEKRDGLHKDSIEEALNKMLVSGIDEVFLQPTFVIKGIEYNIMLEEMKKFEDKFIKLEHGEPLLSRDDDYRRVAEIMRMHLPGDKNIVLVGHGTEHEANSAYHKMDETFKSMGMTNFFISTVEGGSEIDDVINMMKTSNHKEVLLAPFMIVAGDHARNDIATTWKKEFEYRNYKVESLIKGLGEYEEIRRIFVDHVGAWTSR